MPIRRITIETGIPMPTRTIPSSKLTALRIAISTMKAGESFMWESNKYAIKAAAQLKIKITTRKINGEGYRVWRVS